jgi:glutathione peroxidase-family protein
MYKGKVVLVTNVACYCGLTNSNYKVCGTATASTAQVS